MNVWSLLWFTLTRDQGIGTDDGKKKGKKGDLESGEVIYDKEIDSEIVPGAHERNMKEKEHKWKIERLIWLKKKLEKLEMKSKKNGKLTQKEEEIKEMVIEEIDYLESNAPRPLQIGVLETFVSDEELKRKQKKERLRLLKKKLEKLEKKSKKNDDW